MPPKCKGIAKQIERCVVAHSSAHPSSQYQLKRVSRKLFCVTRRAQLRGPGGRAPVTQQARRREARRSGAQPLKAKKTVRAKPASRRTKTCLYRGNRLRDAHLEDGWIDPVSAATRTSVSCVTRTNTNVDANRVRILRRHCCKMP